MKIDFTRCEFHFDVWGNRDFSIHWERNGDGGKYLANVFRGGGYHVSYPVKIAPNQSNSLSILKQFLKEYPQENL